MKLNIYICLLLVAASSILGTSCKKKDITVPPFVSFFTATSGNYIIAEPSSIYKIPIGLTQPSDGNKTVTISVASSTGAVEGTHFTLNKKTFSFIKGQAIDTLVVSGIQSQYLAGRTDVIEFTIAEGDGSHSATLSKKFTLNVQGPCFDGDIDNINVIAGSFANSTDPDEPKYTATITDMTLLTTTTATAKVGNLWAWFGPVTINFDWTDPNNTIVSIPVQQTNRTYAAGQPFLIRTTPGTVSKFSVCDQEITIIADLLVDNYFGPGQAAAYAREFVFTLKR